MMNRKMMMMAAVVVVVLVVMMYMSGKKDNLVTTFTRFHLVDPVHHHSSTGCSQIQSHSM